MNSKNKYILILGIFLILGILTPNIKAQEKTILVSSPKNDQKFYLGDIIIIKWTPPERFKHVIIILILGFKKIGSIDMFVNNSGTFEWFIDPEDFNDGEEYRIKISCFGDLNYYGYSGTFSLIERSTLLTPIKIDISLLSIVVIIIVVIMGVIMNDFKGKKRIIKYINKKKNKKKNV